MFVKSELWSPIRRQVVVSRLRRARVYCEQILVQKRCHQDIGTTRLWNYRSLLANKSNIRVLKLSNVDPYKVRLLLPCLQKLMRIVRQSTVVTANKGYYLLAYYLYIVLYLHENTTSQNFDNSMFRYDAVLELTLKVNEAVFSCSSKQIRLFYLRVLVTV